MTATVTLNGRRYRYRREDGPGLVDAALQYLEGLCVRETDPITDPTAARDYLRLKLLPRKREVFGVMFLDNRHRLIEYREMFKGTINSASVHPREVARVALELNAAALIVGHNHPSGAPTPGLADETVTQHLKDALRLIDVRLLDHIVVGAEGVVSFAEVGKLRRLFGREPSWQKVRGELIRLARRRMKDE